MRLPSDARSTFFVTKEPVSSPITKRVYKMALDEFLRWFQQGPRGGEPEQIQLLLGHASVQTTERRTRTSHLPTSRLTDGQ
jgi:hypothetical protein